MAKQASELDDVIDRLASTAGWEREQAAGILGQYGESLIEQAAAAARNRLAKAADKLKGPAGGRRPRPRSKRAPAGGGGE